MPFEHATTAPFTTEDAGSQDGDAAGGAWLDGLAFLNFALSGSWWSGLYFRRDTSNTPDPPVLAAATLALTSSPIGDVAGTLSAYIVPDSTPALYSTTLLPGTRGEIPTDAPTRHLLGSTTGPFSSDILLTLNPSVLAAGATGQANASGDIAISLRFVRTSGGGTAYRAHAAESASGAPPTLTLTTVPFLTGIVGPWRAQSRVDRCPRCGQITLREKLMKDGYQPGQLVCRECWDPEEPRRARFIPRERPGVND